MWNQHRLLQPRSIQKKSLEIHIITPWNTFNQQGECNVSPYGKIYARGLAERGQEEERENEQH